MATAQNISQRAFPDVIFQSQFFDSMGQRAITSEQRLMLAALSDAINILQHRRHRQRTFFAEARSWVFESDSKCPLAFEQVCDALEINAEVLRDWIESMLSGNAGAPSVPRLRLKEQGRPQCLTLKRPSRHDRRNRRQLGRA